MMPEQALDNCPLHHTSHLNIPTSKGVFVFNNRCTSHHLSSSRVHCCVRRSFLWLWLKRALHFQGRVKIQPTVRRRASAVRSLRQLAWWPGWGTQRASWASWRTNRWLLLFTKPTRALRKAKRWKPWMKRIFLFQTICEKCLHNLKEAL